MLVIFWFGVYAIFYMQLKAAPEAVAPTPIPTEAPSATPTPTIPLPTPIGYNGTVEESLTQEQLAIVHLGMIQYLPGASILHARLNEKGQFEIIAVLPRLLDIEIYEVYMEVDGRITLSKVLYPATVL